MLGRLGATIAAHSEDSIPQADFGLRPMSIVVTLSQNAWPLQTLVGPIGVQEIG